MIMKNMDCNEQEVQMPLTPVQVSVSIAVSPSLKDK